MTKTGTSSVRVFIAAVLSIAVLAIGSSAHAAGRVEWKSTNLKESEGHAWTIEVSIFLSRAPDVATLPMRFSFLPSVYYERARLDGKDGPQERKVPLEGKPPLVESVDVGFLDPGNGQIQKRTKFSFKVTRGHGYEAGEYDVTIRDGRTDTPLGAPVHLVFDGENEVIDRRAVVFSGEKKEKAKGTDEKKEDAPQKKELSPDDPAYWQGGPADTEKKEEVEPKKGCGCRVGTTDEHTGAIGLSAALGALGLVRLRRRTRLIRSTRRSRRAGEFLPRKAPPR